MRNEENYYLPWEYDKDQLTIWQKDTSDDGNQENAEIANNVDPDLGKFIVTACNAHEDLVKALIASQQAVNRLAGNINDPQREVWLSIRKESREAIAKAGVKS